MNLAEAERRYIAAKEAKARAEEELELAGDVLKAWFRKSGKARRGRIGYALRSQTRLDTRKVKAELGNRLPQFQRVVEFEQLSVLE